MMDIVTCCIYEMKMHVSIMSIGLIQSVKPPYMKIKASPWCRVMSLCNGLGITLMVEYEFDSGEG